MGAPATARSTSGSRRWNSTRTCTSTKKPTCCSPLLWRWLKVDGPTVLDRFPFGPAELDRWLELWDETVDELVVGDVATLAKTRARTVAGAIATLARRQVLIR